MMELKITVDMPGVSDAINNLAEAIRCGSSDTKVKHECACEKENKPEPDQKAEALKAEPKAEAPKAEPEAEPKAEPKAEPDQKAEPKKVTQNDILKTAAPLIDIDGGGEKLMALLKKFGVIGVPQLPEESYPAFYEGLLEIVKELS